MTSSIDITPEQREALLALLHRHLPGVTVRAYGSRVKGTAARIPTSISSSSISAFQRRRFHEIIGSDFVILSERA
jgi:hypothetical protein